MRNKFTIAEGEIQRILGLHKQAILKENKIILSEGYALNLISRGDGYNSGAAPEVWAVKTINFGKKYGDILKATVVDSDKSAFNNIEINCKTKVLTIKSDGAGSTGQQVDNTTYDLGSLKSTVEAKCGPADVPKKVVDKPVDEPKKVVDKPVNEPKKEVNCKNKNPYNALTDGGLNWKKEKRKWVDANCNGTTPCIFGNSKTNINLRNAFCDKTWPTNQNNSNKYTFDFDAIMKAINDTGKCAGSWGSSDGTKGTSGTQGTSGTNVIQNPLPINNKISADLYYKIIAN